MVMYKIWNRYSKFNFEKGFNLIKLAKLESNTCVFGNESNMEFHVEFPH